MIVVWYLHYRHIVNRIMNLHAPGIILFTFTFFFSNAILPILDFHHKIIIFVEWSGEVRSITYSADAKSVSVVYRVTLYGTDAEVGILFRISGHVFTI